MAQFDSLACTIGHELDEVIVKGYTILHKTDRDIYMVTSKQLKESTDVLDLLNKLPGINYEPITNVVSVKMDKNVLFQVDGIERSQEYLSNLALDRIQRVEVINRIPERYTIQGYKYILNIKLHKDYIGNDFILKNYCMLDLAHNNGDNFVANEQPAVSLSHASKNIDVYFLYGYGNIHWNYVTNYDKIYNQASHIYTGNYDVQCPNYYYSYLSHTFAGGLTYHIKDNQHLSFTLTYLHEKIRDEYNNHIFSEDLQSSSSTISTEDKSDVEKSPDLKTSLYYQATFNKFDLYMDLSYNKHDADRYHSYSAFSNFNSVNKYHDLKNYLYGNVDLTYHLQDENYINMGFLSIMNNITSRSLPSEMRVSDIRDKRLNIYTKSSFALKPNLTLETGVAFDIIKRQEDYSANKYFYVLPDVDLTYMFSNSSNISLSYNTNISYPEQMQLLESPYYLDSMIVSIGNPQLNQALTHTISVQGTLFDKFQYVGQLELIPNDINMFFTTQQNKPIQTYINASSKTWLFQVSHEWNITEALTWENSIQYMSMYKSYNGISNHTKAWIGNSELSFFYKSINTMATLEYSRGMFRAPLIQGFQEYGQDLWELAIQKKILKDRLSLSLNYVLPIKWGVRQNQNSYIISDFHSESTNFRLNTYNNVLMLRVRFNLSKGRKSRHIEQKKIFEDELRNDRGLL